MVSIFHLIHTNILKHQSPASKRHCFNKHVKSITLLSSGNHVPDNSDWHMTSMLDLPPTDLTLNIEPNNNPNPTNNMFETTLNGM